LQYLDRAIIGPAILNMIKQMGVVLCEYAVDRRAKEAAVIEARCHDGNARRLFWQGRRGWQHAQIESSGRVLFICPHRRTKPNTPAMSAQPCIGLLQLALVGG